MKSPANCSISQPIGMALSLLSWHLCQSAAQANPTGGTVAQGAATFKSTGPQLTVNTTGNAFINWEHFNIAPGETTTFVEPSATSVVWNQINDPNPSQILGTLNANGYIVLQNQSGFVVGGQASLNTHGLLMTTAPSPAPNFSSGGPWSFSAPPPTAKIINYGQINISGGGSAFLIASDIENNGSISAPSGKIGLYAGEKVLVSMTPDGRSLSAQVTLPQGSVDNEGHLIADGGAIAAQALTVNQNGLVQANSAQYVNGTIELVAGDDLTLGAKSDVEANGLTRTSPGGTVNLQAGNNLETQAGSTINVSGSAEGGVVGQQASLTAQAGNTLNLDQGSAITADGGKISLQAATVNQSGNLQANSVSTAPGAITIEASGAINLGASSAIAATGDNNVANTSASPGGSIMLQAGSAFTDQPGSVLNVSGSTLGGPGGQVTISAPQMSALNSSLNATASSGSANGSLTIDTTSILLNGDGSATPNGLALNANAFSAGFSTINLQAVNSIEIAAPWNLPDYSIVSLLAGDTINVDATAGITANAGHLNLNAATVNQYGTLRADSVGAANGVVEIDASQALNLAASSTISAQGDATSAQPSPGGFVVLQSGNTFSDTAGSALNVAGQAGGQDGIIEILGNINSQTGGTVQSTLSSSYALLINPYDMTLAGSPTDTSTANPFLNVNDLANYSQIDLHALDNIELSATLKLSDATAATSINLVAGNNLTLDAGANLIAGDYWNVNLTAGAALPAGATPNSGYDGIYLDGGAFVQTQNGNIAATAANEVIIQDSAVDPTTGEILSPSGAMRTLAGGNISVTALAGNVNTGDNINGYNFGLTAAPWYDVNSANLGGISTAAGGNVTITAKGSVTSYLPTQSDYNNNGEAGYDAGAGAFGPNPGNVTITAGTTVAGNYVVADGIGTVTAGGNAGVPVTDSQDEGFALSLVKGNWTVSAPNIYLDDVMNPNGVFNDASTTIVIGRGGKPLPSGGPGAHLFDYDPAAALTLNGADSVEITGAAVPLLPGSDTVSVPIPILLPPSLTINAGAGGITLDTDVITYPSADGNVNLSTSAGGDLSSRQNPNQAQSIIYNFEMSDSGQAQWTADAALHSKPATFGPSDHASTPPEVNNPTPVDINISGNIDDLNIYTTKETELTVGGNMFNGSFIGENLHATDVTAINVAGSITFSPIYALDTVTVPLGSSGVNILSQIVDDNATDPLSAANSIPANDVGNASALNALAQSETIQQLNGLPANLGFVYNPATLQLGYAYQMSSAVLSALEKPLVTIQYAFGQPEIALGQASLGQNPALYYFVTAPVTFNPLTIPAPGQAPVSAVGALYQASQVSVANALSLPTGFQIGGPGQFVVNAGTLNLGASGGIISWGGGNGSQSVGGGVNYASLDSLTGAAGAAINVNVAGDIGMLTSTIASIGGGDVNVNSAGGEIDLGLAGVPFAPPSAGNLAFGIFTSAAGDVTVTADKDINIDTARIAAFNGGNVTVESYNGDVNAGNGANQDLQILVYYPDGGILAATPEMTNPRPYGSGIIALSATPAYRIPGSSGLPGNINVTTPNGDIVSTLGGISQFALDGNVSGGPVVNLTAGTADVTYIKDPSGQLRDSAGHVDYGLIVNGIFVPEGNIDLGKGGVVGGTVNLSAEGNISGLIVSRQDSNITSKEQVAITDVAGGNANVKAQSVTGDIVAQGSVGVEGLDSAQAFSSNVSANGTTTSTLGAASASSSSQAAASQSSKQALASTDTSSDDLDKKKKLQPVALKVKRVTVILPGKT